MDCVEAVPQVTQLNTRRRMETDTRPHTARYSWLLHWTRDVAAGAHKDSSPLDHARTSDHTGRHLYGRIQGLRLYLSLLMEPPDVLFDRSLSLEGPFSIRRVLM